MTTTADSTAEPAAGGRRGAVVVLTARPVRRRKPSATVWRLLTYDPATRTPVADIAQSWQPAGAPRIATSPVPVLVADWVAAVLGRHAVIGPDADTYAGPDSWYVQNPAGHLQAEHPRAVAPR